VSNAKEKPPARAFRVRDLDAGDRAEPDQDSPVFETDRAGS
jgi:hypothetical protein